MGQQDGKVHGVNWVINNGPTSSRFNIVIVAEGYTQRELGTFATDAQQLATDVLAIPPFDTLGGAINFLRLDVESTDSGADDPSPCGGTGAWEDTYFDATFCGSGIGRLLKVDRWLVKDALTTHAPFWHAAIVLVNSPKYGGSGYFQIAVCSKDPDAVHIAVHELGHSAFGLDDEYDGQGAAGQYPNVEPSTCNLTLETQRRALKWNAFVKATTPIPTRLNPNCGRPQPPPPTTEVGSYEGGGEYDCDVFRPAQVCKMNRLQDDFCPVCSDQIRKTLLPFLSQT